MPIEPLPVLQEEKAEREKELAAANALPNTLVVRYGAMGYIAELRNEANERAGCGAKVVARTPRGVELATVLTTTCANGGCGHNLSRKQMLAYIERSGGRQFPFTSEGKVLRLATPEDLHEQAHLDANRSQYTQACKQYIREYDLPMKLVDVEALLGGDRIVFHFMSEGRVDFRELVRRLAADFHTRIEMRQVGARDEARIAADYEKCGQHCCCKQFLKVLKPVSMRSAKIQKATLDPSKISGRCGRLMCCLRYEDETYDDLRKRLPPRNTRLMTAEGPAVVLSTQILTQLVMVELEVNHTRAVFPVEELEQYKGQPVPPPGAVAEEQRQARRDERKNDDRRRSRADRSDRQSDTPLAKAGDSSETADQSPQADAPATEGQAPADGDQPKRKRRRRRRRRRKGGDGGGEDGGGGNSNASPGSSGDSGGD
jgi:cell fate regulator YaaT (PSP1 superfamily)